MPAEPVFVNLAFLVLTKSNRELTQSSSTSAKNFQHILFKVLYLLIWDLYPAEWIYLLYLFSISIVSSTFHISCLFISWTPLRAARILAQSENGLISFLFITKRILYLRETEAFDLKCCAVKANLLLANDVSANLRISVHRLKYLLIWNLGPKVHEICF